MALLTPDDQLDRLRVMLRLAGLDKRAVIFFNTHASKWPEGADRPGNPWRVWLQDCRNANPRLRSFRSFETLSAFVHEFIAATEDYCDYHKVRDGEAVPT